jgi:hypothetical protein
MRGRQHKGSSGERERESGARNAGHETVGMMSGYVKILFKSNNENHPSKTSVECFFHLVAATPFSFFAFRLGFSHAPPSSSNCPPAPPETAAATFDDSQTFSVGTTTAAAVLVAAAGEAAALTFFVTAFLFATKLARSTSSASPLATPTCDPLIPLDAFFATGGDTTVEGAGDAAFAAAGFVAAAAACLAGAAFSAFLATLFDAPFSSNFPADDDEDEDEDGEETSADEDF